MEKILNQEEIDALFRAAQEQGRASGARPRLGEAGGARPRVVVVRDFRQAGQISKEQVRAVSMLHEGFARNLTHSLGAYLRVLFEVNLVSVEQLSYAEFLQRVPEITYFASINLQPVDVLAAVQLDLALAFPIIDLMLGGPGVAEAQAREITEIEEHILESVVKVLCRELQTAWQPLLELQFEFAQRYQQAQIMQLMPPGEKVLSLSFEIRMPEVRGMLNVVFPAMVSGALLRRLSKQWTGRKRRVAAPGSGGERQLRQLPLLECLFPVELRLEATGVRVEELLGLEPGRILRLASKVHEPALLLVAGQNLFTAFPVRSGIHRGGQIAGKATPAGSAKVRLA
jgi:flagellar motor switch protein FliM